MFIVETLVIRLKRRGPLKVLASSDSRPPAELDQKCTRGVRRIGAWQAGSDRVPNVNLRGGLRPYVFLEYRVKTFSLNAYIINPKMQPER